MTASRISQVAHARRALFRMGEELSGARLAGFVADLLAAADQEPDQPTEVLIERAMAMIEDGPIRLAAEEPFLSSRQLKEPVSTTDNAARAAVADFARELLARKRAGDFDDLWAPPTR